jgi:hypothetical protein
MEKGLSRILHTTGLNLYLIIALAIMILVTLFSESIAKLSMGFVEEYLSPDNAMQSGIPGLQKKIHGVVVLGFALWIGVVLLRSEKVGGRLLCILFPTRVKVFFTGTESKGVFYKYHMWLLACSTVAGAIIAALYMYRTSPVLESIFMEDGFFENLTVLLFFISSILFLMVFYLRKKRLRLSLISQNTLMLIFAILGILICFEEISWGQRIFDIETPEVMKSKNYQGEMNFHNLFNPYYNVFYPLFGMFLFMVCLLGWIPIREPRMPWFKLIFPHPSLFPLAFFIMNSGGAYQDELMEIYLSFFVLFYSLQLYLDHVYKQEDEFLLKYLKEGES